MIYIEVFHPEMARYGLSTRFSGPQCVSRVDEHGNLFIQDWKTDTQKGTAVFAHGNWNYICMSIDLP